jgi:hypothetical protein
MHARIAIGAALLLCFSGCDGGGDGAGGHGGDGGHAGHAMTGGSAGAGGSSGGSTATGGSGGTGGDSGPPLAPTTESATPLEGVLHVKWTNNTPDCEKIELDRKKDDGAYATEYTLNGAATSQHDSGATPPGMYCYKARCIKGADTSPDSNEVCGTP